MFLGKLFAAKPKDEGGDDREAHDIADGSIVRNADPIGCNVQEHRQTAHEEEKGDQDEVFPIRTHNVSATIPDTPLVEQQEEKNFVNDKKAAYMEQNDDGPIQFLPVHGSPLSCVDLEDPGTACKGCAQDSMEQAFPATMPPPHSAWRSGQAAGHRRCNVQDEGPLRQDPPGRHGRFPHADPHALPCIRKAKSRRPAAAGWTVRLCERPDMRGLRLPRANTFRKALPFPATSHIMTMLAERPGP